MTPGDAGCPRPWFVVVEGLDGAGKSTLVQGLRASFDAVVLSSSNAITAEVRATCERMHGLRGTSRQLFYAYSVSLTSDAAGRALDRGERVVVDRYWASTVAYPRIMGDATEAIEGIAATLRTPTLTLFLDVPRAVRAARIEGRGGAACGIDAASLERDEALRAAYMEAFRVPGVVGELAVIAADRGPEEVLRSACDAIRRITCCGGPLP